MCLWFPWAFHFPCVAVCLVKHLALEATHNLFVMSSSPHTVTQPKQKGMHGGHYAVRPIRNPLPILKHTRLSVLSPRKCPSRRRKNNTPNGEDTNPPQKISEYNRSKLRFQSHELKRPLLLCFSCRHGPNMHAGEILIGPKT